MDNIRLRGGSIWIFAIENLREGGEIKRLSAGRKWEMMFNL